MRWSVSRPAHLYIRDNAVRSLPPPLQPSRFLPFSLLLSFSLPDVYFTRLLAAFRSLFDFSKIWPRVLLDFRADNGRNKATRAAFPFRI